MKRAMSDILKEASSAPNREAVIAVLRKHDSMQIRQLLVATFDPSIVWLLPDGAPPFQSGVNSTGQHDLETALYTEMRKFYLYIKSPNRLFGDEGNPNLSMKRRESLFIQLLESLNTGDAELVIAAKDKHLPESMKNVTADLVNEAFPGVDIPVVVVA